MINTCEFFLQMPKFRILFLTIVLLFELTTAVRVDGRKVDEKKSGKDRRGKSKLRRVVFEIWLQNCLARNNLSMFWNLNTDLSHKTCIQSKISINRRITKIETKMTFEFLYFSFFSFLHRHIWKHGMSFKVQFL